MFVILWRPIFGNRIYAERVTLYLVECAQPAGWWPGTCLRRLCPGDCAAFLKLVWLLQDVFRLVLGHALFYHCMPGTDQRTECKSSQLLLDTGLHHFQFPILFLTEFNYQPLIFYANNWSKTSGDDSNTSKICQGQWPSWIWWCQTPRSVANKHRWTHSNLAYVHHENFLDYVH